MPVLPGGGGHQAFEFDDGAFAAAAANVLLEGSLPGWSIWISLALATAVGVSAQTTEWRRIGNSSAGTTPATAALEFPVEGGSGLC